MRFPVYAVRAATCLAAVICACLPGLSHAQDVRAYRCVPANQPPTIETLGGLAADQLLTTFTNSGGDPAQVQTRAAALFDQEAIHFLIECMEPNMEDILAKHTEDGAYLFEDDCVEIFLSPVEGDQLYGHFATNANGARFQERVKDRTWEVPWTVQAHKGTDRWTLQVRIPWTAFGPKPDPGGVWWFNVCRQRHEGEKLELSAWSPNGSNFHDTTRFAAMVFDDAYGPYLKTDILDQWDAQASALRERARIDPAAEAKLQEAMSAIEKSLAPVRATSTETAPPLARFAAMITIGREALADLYAAKGFLDGAIARREVAEAMAKLAPESTELLAYSVRAVTDRQILPIPDVPDAIAHEVSLRACRGEYEPASFVVYPLVNTVRLELQTSDLTGPTGTIPASAVDIRAVKCWYQSGGFERFPINRGMRKMTPELLLKDDDLVRVDTENRENFIKLKFSDGRREWLWVSSPETTPEEKDLSAQAMPIRDEKTLQPVNIPAREAKQFWVTVRVPDDAKSGVYQGEIALSSMNSLLGRLKLKVEVLPFDLADNPLESSMYFHWGIDVLPDGEETLNYRRRTWSQYRAELRNLLAHGVDNPTLGIRFETGNMREGLQARKEIGMRMDHLYYLVAGAWSPPEKIKEIIAIAREFGYEDVYFYGRDEARGDALKAQREQWEQVRELGGKTFVAGSQGHNFPEMGDIQDLLVCYGDPSKEEAARWHSKGHKIFCYANPQSGIEAPETYRRNYGLLLAANDYDGGMTYIFYHGWNDFNGDRYRQHNFVYPTVDGLIDTIQWEGYREGIDDLRYLGTLREAIKTATALGGQPAQLARDAQGFLDNMDVTGDLYEVRDGMIDWIVQLRKACE